MIHRFLAVALVAFFNCAFAQGLSGGSVVSATTKAAFREAIESGSAETWVGSMVQGEINQALGRPLDARIMLKLTREKQFNPDCGRVRMSFQEPGGKPLLELGMNVCKDGSPPLEGANLATPFPSRNSTSIPRAR